MGKELAALKAQPAPVQPVAVTYKEVADTMNALWGGTLKQVQIAMELANKKLYAAPPAAQRQWAGLTDEEMYLNCPNWLSQEQCKVWVAQIETKLKGKNTAAQPAVPDAIHHTDLSEHPQYIEGWNDCRAEMLKGMKP
jgi:hypothetical protein